MGKQLLYFHPGYSSFVKKDLRLLGENFTIKDFLFKLSPKYLIPAEFLREFFFILLHIRSSDILICQFGGYHSFLPCLIARVWGKPSLIITGGTDSVSFPSINYGNFSKKLLGIFTEWSYRLASHVSPVHESLIEYEYTYQDKDYPKQGIRFFCRNYKTPYTVIYNGYNPGQWHPISPREKNTFLTVAAGLRMKFSRYLKGIDLILGVAPHFPECKFYILGAEPDINFAPVPPNVILIPPVDHEKLIGYYSRSEFYLQLSISEGFPNALCEAMLCECIPIGSNVGAIPDIIGDSGFILFRRDVEELKNLLRKVLIADKTLLPQKARNRISENYTEERRKKELTALLENLNAGTGFSGIEKRN